MNFMEHNANNFKIPELKEAYDSVRTSLGEEAFKQYTIALKRYFSAFITKVKFDEDARKLLCTPEQIHLHNIFLLSLTNKIEVNRSNSGSVKKECVDYLSPSSPMDTYWETGPNIRYVTQEMCLPDYDLIKGRVIVSSIEHGLEDAEDDVANIIVIAVQMFLKNIITAMASKIRGYKIRENNFQYAIGLPVPNPWIRNSSNILDSTQEPNTEINKEERTFGPRVRDTLETVQQQMTYGYSCSGSQVPSVARLTLKLMYETLLYNPYIINCHSIHSAYLERILSQLDCS